LSEDISYNIKPRKTSNNDNHVWKLQSERSFNNCELDKEIDYGDLFEGEKLMYIKIKIEIEDTGVGIKKENLSKLFMDFGKLDEHSKINAQGTGLGLSICKKMIEKMGGAVSVDSIEGEGTTFTVHLAMRAKLSSNNKPKESSDHQSFSHLF
jgi:signal transduction histidine kinase